MKSDVWISGWEERFATQSFSGVRRDKTRPSRVPKFNPSIAESVAALRWRLGPAGRRFPPERPSMPSATSMPRTFLDTNTFRALQPNNGYVQPNNRTREEANVQALCGRSRCADPLVCASPRRGRLQNRRRAVQRLFQHRMARSDDRRCKGTVRHVQVEGDGWPAYHSEGRGGHQSADPRYP